MENKDQSTQPPVDKNRDPKAPLEKSGTTRQPVYKRETGTGAASGDPTQ